jgi:hypothetical protein
VTRANNEDVVFFGSHVLWLALFDRGEISAGIAGSPPAG